jgi:hypothetical protein
MKTELELAQRVAEVLPSVCSRVQDLNRFGERAHHHD